MNITFSKHCLYDMDCFAPDICHHGLVDEGYRDGKLEYKMRSILPASASYKDVTGCLQTEQDCAVQQAVRVPGRNMSISDQKNI